MPSTGTSGKAARLVLRQRLAVARRGADLLSRKRQALLAEQRRLRDAATAAAGEWAQAIAEAERWLARSALLDDAGEIARIASYAQHAPELTVAWEPLMGIVRPRIAVLEQGPAPPISSLGGSSALHYAALAYRRATRAAAAQAAAQIALEQVSHELATVARRARAIERRLIPRQEAELATLELSLEESEREEAARLRLLTRRRGQP
ncbi:MAG: V-type ATP synthase subunit D [Solirubrobacteraceae bacterium]|jgi:V/A-type H+-transporting ATPase subunit D